MKRRFTSLFSMAALLAAPQVLAETPAHLGDFTFRRVAVPPRQSTAPRITVQIDPGASSAPLVSQSAEQAQEVPGGLAWFWAGVSPDLKDVEPGRLTRAVGFLENAPAGQVVAPPGLQRLQTIADAHGAEILQATVGTNVSPAFVLAVIAVESSGRANAQSSAGAAGLMQLMPDTAARFGVSDPMVPEQNIRGGIAYLDWLMQEFEGDPIMVLAGYNAGENAVRSHGGVPPYSETRAYVPKVLAAWSVARGMCLTPPELISDGCVFAVRRVSAK